MSTCAPRMGMARPLLFQNSLHNATTGFASIHHHITGPSLSVSAMENTPSECIEASRCLLQEGIVDFCFITLVEAHASVGALMECSPLLEGACTWLVSTESVVKSKGLKPLAQFTDPASSLDYKFDPDVAPLISLAGSGFLERSLQWIKK